MPVDINQVVPLTPVDRGDGTRRRRPAGEAAPAPTDTREQDKARAAKPVAGKKRQVVSREDIYAGAARTARGRKRKVPTKKTHKTPLTTPAAHKRVVRIDGTISVGELGKELGVKATELIQKLISMGMMVSINAQIDEDTATLLANEYGYEVEDVGFDEDEFLDTPDEDVADPEAVLRAPVITVMGHVDHGKTSLLDRIRKANVAAGEAGGITQHIGAYKVTTAQGDVVFLDTPGHAAFTAMRARGAQVTDLVVLVVAADDGVMPQTIEAISHAKAAEVPVIVAINKIDKPGADIERIKQELTKYGLVAEEWGGETMMVPVSALKGTGVQELLEALALQAEVLELKANPKKPAFGRVVEARMDKGRGPVATVLVQEGTLKVGDFMVSGAQCGRLRAMVDDKGNRLKEAGPSTPVEVLGLDGIPGAGEAFHIVANEKDARRVVEARFDKAREKDLAASSASAAAAQGGDVFARLNQANKETLRVILKTDVQGSLEALRSILEQLTTDEVSLRIIHSGVGGITEGDVTLAQASEAVCIGFNVGPDTNAKRLADQTGVKIRKFEVVYEVADEVKLMMGGLLAPEIVETQLGRAEVRASFQVARMGAVAGCFILEGKIQRNVRGRVYREGKMVHEGKIVGLKRFKEDVREVATGFECGIAVDNYTDIQTGDIIEAVEIKEVARKLA
ncbi:translation initiation factor IF-2 [Myxococcota bacterium]|jgi:translation initiation factor IF-2|nr:translation initiation factor IF-2 [Myxococcota bacterium]